MKIKKVLISSLLGLLASSNALAGVYSDELSKCLVSSTTKGDRVELVKWMFSAASAHPAVKTISSITPVQMEEANKNVAQLFMRLTTESCLEQTKNAIAYEGTLAFQSSFQVLGQVAGQEMFASPEVVAGMAGLEKHLDEEKLSSILSAQ
ncbi:hypothetical protein NMR74_004519 [Vibrio parahaemolyticus]|nr:hypothetical protein [Vibrio parahaemolyticus]